MGRVETAIPNVVDATDIAAARWNISTQAINALPTTAADELMRRTGTYLCTLA